MRTSYLVSYDICDDKRLRKVFQTMRGYGDHLQYSVFQCQLTAADRYPSVAHPSVVAGDTQIRASRV